MRAPNSSTLPKSSKSIPIIDRHFTADLRGCIAHATSLELLGSMSEAVWRDVGATLGKMSSATNWWIGDWWAFGEHRYGDRKALVESDDWQGPGFQSCMNAAAVAQAFETSRRREVLSFSHHAEAASLAADEADALLDWAEEAITTTGKAHSVRSMRDEKARRAQPWGIPVVVLVTTVPATPSVGHAIVARAIDQSIPSKIVGERVVAIRAAPPAQPARSYQGLSSVMYCLSQLGASDGAQIATLVDRERRDEFLQAAQAAQSQLAALIAALGA